MGSFQVAGPRCNAVFSCCQHGSEALSGRTRLSSGRSAAVVRASPGVAWECRCATTLVFGVVPERRAVGWPRPAAVSEVSHVVTSREASSAPATLSIPPSEVPCQKTPALAATPNVQCTTTTEHPASSPESGTRSTLRVARTRLAALSVTEPAPSFDILRQSVHLRFQPSKVSRGAARSQQRSGHVHGPFTSRFGASGVLPGQGTNEPSARSRLVTSAGTQPDASSPVVPGCVLNRVAFRSPASVPSLPGSKDLGAPLLGTQLRLQQYPPSSG
jgi:hypothetical protein